MRAVRRHPNSDTNRPLRATKGPAAICLFALSEVANPVEQHGEYNGAADEGTLPKGVDAKQSETVADYFDQSGADKRAGGGTDTTSEIGAANDGCGDHLQFHSSADVGGDRSKPSGLDDAGDPR